MPDLWNAPPFPAQGDGDEDLTYRAVGHAITRWEEAETALAELYSLLIENPGDLQSIKDYGNPSLFSARIANLCRAAQGYFSKYPNQALEAVFDSVQRHALGWAQRRAEIAHGIVQFAHYQIRYSEQYANEGKLRYVLVPAFYTHRKHDEYYRPTYCYASNEMDIIAAGFFELRQMINDFKSARRSIKSGSRLKCGAPFRATDKVRCRTRVRAQPHSS